MTGTTGERLLRDLDFGDLQNDLFQILEVIMTKKEFVYDDRAIMESATNLWISAIVFNQELLQVIFDQWNASQQRIRRQDLLSDHLQGVRERQHEL